MIYKGIDRWYLKALLYLFQNNKNENYKPHKRSIPSDNCYLGPQFGQFLQYPEKTCYSYFFSFFYFKEKVYIRTNEECALSQNWWAESNRIIHWAGFSKICEVSDLIAARPGSAQPSACSCIVQIDEIIAKWVVWGEFFIDKE